MLEDVSWSHFFAFKKTFFKVSVHSSCHCFTWDHWPTKFLIVFLQATISRITMCNLHRCYTWIALVSANQNRVIFTCGIFSKLSCIYRRMSYSAWGNITCCFRRNSDSKCYYISVAIDSGQTPDKRVARVGKPRRSETLLYPNISS